MYKRLPIPLLLTVISAIGIGISSPVRSASLLGSQSTNTDAKPEAKLIAGNPCPYGLRPYFPPPCNTNWNVPTPVQIQTISETNANSNSSTQQQSYYPRINNQRPLA